MWRITNAIRFPIPDGIFDSTVLKAADFAISDRRSGVIRAARFSVTPS